MVDVLRPGAQPTQQRGKLGSRVGEYTAKIPIATTAQIRTKVYRIAG